MTAPCIFIIVFVIGLFLAPRIGPAWDEPDNIFAGGQYATFFGNGMNPRILTRRDPDASEFGDRIFTQEPAIARYPPFPNYIGTLIAKLSALPNRTTTGKDIIVSFHLATALFFALLVATVFPFGKLLGFSYWESALAALFTFSYPTLFGHGLSNLKDTSQVALFTLSLYFLAKFTLLKHRSALIAGALIWGLGLASKFNAVYIPVIYIVWILLTKRGKLASYTLPMLTVLVIGLVTTVLLWPYLWFDPVNRIGEVIAYFTTVGQGYRLFWNGTLYQVGVGQILWWYPFANILLGTPPLLLVLIVAGVWSAMRTIISRHSSWEKVFLLFVWIAIPLLRAFLPNAAFYDGMRHFMEILPPLLLTSVLGLRFLLSRLERVRHISMVTRWYVVAPIFLHLFVVNMLYFPYSTGYLNMFANNPNERFDRDIEALSVKESVDYLHRKYGDITLWSPIGGHLSWYYLTPADRYVYSATEADTIILVNKSSHIREKEFRETLPKQFALDNVIVRGNAIFAWIYRQR